MLRRDFAAVRAAEVSQDGRSVILACVPFDSPAWVSDGGAAYREVFRPGAFRNVASAPNRVELRYRHDESGAPYGFGIEITERTDYVEGVFRVAPSAAGDQLLALVRDEQLRGVSIGYVAGRSRTITDDDGPLTERLNVRQLTEVSLTNAPSYADARVLAVREDADIDEIARRERERIYWQRRRFLLG